MKHTWLSVLLAIAMLALVGCSNAGKAGERPGNNAPPPVAPVDPNAPLVPPIGGEQEEGQVSGDELPGDLAVVPEGLNCRCALTQDYVIRCKKIIRDGEEPDYSVYYVDGLTGQVTQASPSSPRKLYTASALVWGKVCAQESGCTLAECTEIVDAKKDTNIKNAEAGAASRGFNDLDCFAELKSDTESVTCE